MWQIDGEEDCVLTWGDLMDIAKYNTIFVVMFETRFTMRSQQRS